MNERRMVLVILITTFIIIASSIPGFTEESPFIIDTDGYLFFDEETNVVEAGGGVSIEFGENSIRGDSLIVYLDEERVLAQGNITLVQDGQELSGESLEYNYRTEEGRFLEGKIVQDKLTFTGEVMNISGDQFVIEDSQLTPCSHSKRPHYKLTAESITVYPNDKVVARGVYLWIRGRKIIPLPTYVTSLKSEERQRESIPKPEIGYSSKDGLYVGIEYDHYISQSFEGSILARATTGGRNRLDLDYIYNPSDLIKFNPRINYSQKYGLDTYIGLQNELGNISSDFNFREYTIRDDEDDEYKEVKSLAHWDINTQILGIDASLNFKKDGEKEEIEELFTLEKRWSDYYWTLKGSQNRDVDYRPHLSVGIDEKDLGDGTILSTQLSRGRIVEEETDLRRDKFSFSLRNNNISLSEDSNLYWSGRIEDSYYSNEDSYRTYNFNLGTDTKVLGANLNLDYTYYNELGETPFEFDRLTEDRLVEDKFIRGRHYLSGRLSNSSSLNDRLDLNWSLSGAKNYYEDFSEYTSYGLEAGIDYEINDYNSLSLSYNYRGTKGRIILEDDEIESFSEVIGTYSFRTNRQKYPYWDVDLEAAYDIQEGKLSRLNTSFNREFDCFSAGVEIDGIDRGIRFGLDLKY